MRIALVVAVVGMCCGCAGPKSAGLETLTEPHLAATKTEIIGALVEQSDVIVLGKITGIRDATARGAGIVYDVVLETVLYGSDISAEVLRFRSGGKSGYAQYRMDAQVLLFLQRRDGELIQLSPVCYISGEPTLDALDLRPLAQYRGDIDEAIRSQKAK